MKKLLMSQFAYLSTILKNSITSDLFLWNFCAQGSTDVVSRFAIELDRTKAQLLAATATSGRLLRIEWCL